MYDFSKDNHGRRGVRPGAKPPIRLPRHPRAARPPPSLLVQVASAVDDFSAYPREVGPRPITPLGRVVVHDTHIGMSESAVEGRRRTPSSLQAPIPAAPPSSEQPAASAVPHPTNPGGESSRLRGRLFSHPSRRRGRLLSHPPARGLQGQLPDPPPPPNVHVYVNGGTPPETVGRKVIGRPVIGSPGSNAKSTLRFVVVRTTRWRTTKRPTESVMFTDTLYDDEPE